MDVKTLYLTNLSQIDFADIFEKSYLVFLAQRQKFPRLFLDVFWLFSGVNEAQELPEILGGRVFDHDPVRLKGWNPYLGECF